MNLASMTPAKQVAHVMANCQPGDMPDLPPFLRVDDAEAARRLQWWKDHPPVTTKFGEKESTDSTRQAEAEAFRQRESPRRVAQEKEAAAKKPVRHTEPRDMTGFRWDAMRGRFIPEGYTPPRKTSAPITDEERKLTEALHAENAKRPKGKAAKAPAPKPVEVKPSAPIKGNTSKAKPFQKVKGESKVDIAVKLLRRPEGATLEQVAEKTGWQTHTAQARIGADIKKGMNLIVNRSVEDGRGNVYRIED